MRACRRSRALALLVLPPARKREALLPLAAFGFRSAHLAAYDDETEARVKRVRAVGPVRPVGPVRLMGRKAREARAHNALHAHPLLAFFLGGGVLFSISARKQKSSVFFRFFLAGIRALEECGFFQT